jgi:hypothetical protein
MDDGGPDYSKVTQGNLLAMETDTTSKPNRGENGDVYGVYQWPDTWQNIQ